MTAEMPGEQIDRLLKQISPSLRDLNDDYCIVGSASLYLSGIPLPVHDIDILTSAFGANRLKQEWKDKADLGYKPENPEKFRSHFSRYDFDGFPVEVMGELRVLTSEGWEGIEVKSSQHVDKEGWSVRLPSLEDQKRILRLFGRKKDIEKIKLIEEFENQ